MNKIYYKVLTVVLGIAVFSIFYFVGGNQTKFSLDESQGKTEYPEEWMYKQRAYPDNVINRNAISNAIDQSKEILSTRQPTTGTDWSLVGPLNTGGRITDVAISPDSDDILYVSTAVGGVFKTTDGGNNWNPIFDQIGKPSIGNIAIANSDSQRIYVGTGEANGSATSGAFYGDGIYRSNDAGATWTHMGLDGTDHIGRIVIDPTNPDRVFAAATGRLYGYNEDRGVYKSTNGGNDWERVLFITDSTAIIDVAMNPVNTNILYAAAWERTRKPWIRDYGGVTSGVYRSMDGGDTWSLLGAAQGLPAPDPQTGRIGLAVSESNPNVVYARYTTNEITNVFDGLYKSSDNGNNWTLVTLSELSSIDASFGWYFGNVRVNPEDENEVWVLGQSIYRTVNSGASWQSVGGMHVDHHALEYSRNNNNFILAGNDGGAYISNNGGTTWNKFLNLPITQFYNIEVDNLQPQNLYGGTQDNNTIRTLTAGANDWNSIWGGDGFHVNVDPNDNNFIYVESQFGGIGRSINGGASFSSATAGIDGNDRTNWNTPIIISPFNSEKVFCGTQRVYISDRAALWSPISPDLTNGQHPSGSLSYGTLTALAASYNNLDVIYAGSDDGNVSVTFDGGDSWQNISASLPDRYVTSIAISPLDDNVAYVCFSGFSLLDYTPHVFKTFDGGQSWVDISANLPNIPVNDVIIKGNEDLVFLATDLNVWFSQNQGQSWDILGNNLPLTIIRDLKLHEPTNTLYAGTFGRSMHQYDLNNLVLNIEDNITSSIAIKIYPNPATDFFNIDCQLYGEGKVMLIDNAGKIIKFLFDGLMEDLNTTSLNIEGIPSGSYLLRIENNNRVISKKLIID